MKVSKINVYSICFDMYKANALVEFNEVAF